MANRRMFSLNVIDTDKFLDMPVSSQLLYFHLGMRADDEGVVSSPKRIARTTNCGDDDLRLLVTKGYIIPFESGVVVIKHWKQNNYIRPDRYTPTMYKEELEKLSVINNIYAMPTAGISNDIPNDIPDGIPSDIPNNPQNGIPTVGNMVDNMSYPRRPQVSLGKDSIELDKYSIDKDRERREVEDRESIVNRGYGGKKERERKKPNVTSYPQENSLSYPQSQQMDANDIVELFNTICVTYPTVNSLNQYSTALSNSLMFNRYSKKDYSIIFQKAEQSNVLRERIDSEESPVDLGWILEHSEEIKNGYFDN